MGVKLAKKDYVERIAYNPNLLINSDFRNPINQRGKTEYTRVSAWAYSLDRWCYIGLMNVTVKEGYINLKTDSDATGTCYFKQQFENAIDIDCTLTVNVKSIDAGTTIKHTGTGTALKAGINVIKISAGFSSVEFAITGTSKVVGLYWIKLEPGSLSTPFVPRPYAEELQLCQRYYETSNVMFIPLNLVGGTTYFMAVNGGDYKVEKRAAPTVTFKQFVDNAGNSLSVTASNYAGDTKSFKRVVLSSSISNVYILNTLYIDAEIY